MQTPDSSMFILRKRLQLGEVFQLHDEDSHHALNVMRMRTGDDILVSNGQGIIWKCEILRNRGKRAECLVQSKTVDLENSPYHVTILISQLKNNNRLEVAIEKCVEQGVDEILLCKTHRSSHKPFQQKRIQRLVDAAVKQSKKAFIPSLKYFDSLKDAVDDNDSPQKLMASCVPNLMPIQKLPLKKEKTLFAIGPEGDFTPEELSIFKNAEGQLCTLGEERLRSETAAIVGLAQLKMTLNEI